LSLNEADLSQKLILYLTLEKEDMEVPNEFKKINIVIIGKITHEQVIWMYQQVDVLVFPSYIETLGLPLIEAATEGLPVIASDLDYSREVLRGYEGVAFVPFDDVKQWAISFKNIGSARNRRFEPYVKKDTKSWNDFFDIIKKHL
jgi:glycosyltransferase involved in cell wall biosynthesis